MNEDQIPEDAIEPDPDEVRAPVEREDVPEADALEQGLELRPDDDVPDEVPPEVPEADLIDQRRGTGEVDDDVDERR